MVALASGATAEAVLSDTLLLRLKEAFNEGAWSMMCSSALPSVRVL
jgi:hypothetical protein